MRWFDQWDSNKKRDRKKGQGPGDGVTARIAEDADRHRHGDGDRASGSSVRLHADIYTRAADEATIKDLMAVYLMQGEE